jgi:hypothetical protein
MQYPSGMGMGMGSPQMSGYGGMQSPSLRPMGGGATVKKERKTTRDSPMNASRQPAGVPPPLYANPLASMEIPVETHSLPAARSKQPKKQQAAPPTSRIMSLPTAASYYDSADYTTVPYTAPPRYQSVIECGHVNRSNKRTHRLQSEFFGKEVDIYMAVNDPKRRILYRSSLLSELFMCATNQVGMYMARRRSVEDGIYQATTIRWKPAGRLGLKAGARRNGYFLTLEVCKSFGRHHRHHSQKGRRSRKRRLLTLENKLRNVQDMRAARDMREKAGEGVSNDEVAHNPDDKLAALMMLAETTSTDHELSADEEKTLEEVTLKERAELLAEEERERKLDLNLDRAVGEEEKNMLALIDNAHSDSEDELYEVELSLAALGNVQPLGTMPTNPQTLADMMAMPGMAEMMVPPMVPQAVNPAMPAGKSTKNVAGKSHKKGAGKRGAAAAPLPGAQTPPSLDDASSSLSPSLSPSKYL